MKKTENIANLETAIYVLAITAARDNDATQEQDKEVLAKIRDYMHKIIALKNENPNFTILATAGMSESKGLELVKDLDKSVSI